MVDRTHSDAALREKARAFLPGGNFGNVAGDLVIAEGSGGRVRDVAGKEYVDFLLGSGPMLIGHRHPEVIAAVRGQLEYGTTFFANSAPGILLAEAICEAMPCAEKVRFTSSGSEATLYAMRAVRALRGRSKILKFEGGYHGMNDYALMSLAPARRSNGTDPIPDSPGIPGAVGGEVLVAPYNDLDAVTAIVDEHHESIAGVIVEAFQRVIRPRPGFLEGLRALTERHGLLLVFDEVVTGFRFAYGGAQEFYGVVPDLCTVGKVVGGGVSAGGPGGPRGDHGAVRSGLGGRQWLPAPDRDPERQTRSRPPRVSRRSRSCAGTTPTRGCSTTAASSWTGSRARCATPGSRRGSPASPACSTSCSPASRSSTTGRWRTATRTSSRLFNKVLREHGVLKGAAKFYVSVAHTQDDVDHTIEAFKAAAAAIARH